MFSPQQIIKAIALAPPAKAQVCLAHKQNQPKHIPATSKNSLEHVCAISKLFCPPAARNKEKTTQAMRIKEKGSPMVEAP